MIKVDFASYADDNTPYVTENGVKKVSKSLKETSEKLFHQFADNKRKANPDKCHSLRSSSDGMSIFVNNHNMKNSKCEKLVGIKIDNEFNFNTYTVKSYGLYGIIMHFLYHSSIIVY